MSTKSTSARKKPCASSETKRLAGKKCPSPETVLSVFENPDVSTATSNLVFRHLLRCRECRAALAFVCTSAAEQLERKRQQAAWRRFQAAVVRIARRNAAGAGEIDAIAAGGPAVLVLRSGVAKKEKHNWQADLTFPDADQPNEPLTLKVHGRAGNSVDAGTFVIFGLEIPIKGGVGHLSRTQLLENHHRGGVAFSWPDGSTIAGTPVLNA